MRPPLIIIDTSSLIALEKAIAGRDGHNDDVCGQDVAMRLVSRGYASKLILPDFCFNVELCLGTPPARKACGTFTNVLSHKLESFNPSYSFANDRSRAWVDRYAQFVQIDNSEQMQNFLRDSRAPFVRMALGSDRHVYHTIQHALEHEVTENTTIGSVLRRTGLHRRNAGEQRIRQILNKLPADQPVIVLSEDAHAYRCGSQLRHTVHGHWQGTNHMVAMNVGCLLYNIAHDGGMKQTLGLQGCKELSCKHLVTQAHFNHPYHYTNDKKHFGHDPLFGNHLREGHLQAWGKYRKLFHQAQRASAEISPAR